MSYDTDEIDRLVSHGVPDPTDRFDVDALNRPLAELQFASADETHRHIARHVIDDVARRTDPNHSADLGAFLGLLTSFGVLGRIAASGRLTARSRIEELGTWWFSFFMYYASGPPPARLRQFLALADAGVLRFIGADISVTTDAASGRFVARSSSHPDSIVGNAFVDARIASPSVSRTTDVLLRRLYERGEVVEEVVSDGDGWSANSGKVVVTGNDLRIVRNDGTAHPRRHGVGVFTNRPAAGTFARPRTNAASFRQNDTIARSILRTLANVRTAVAVPSDTVAS